MQIRLASFSRGIELWVTTVDPNGVITPIGIGSIAIRQSAGTVSFWQCTALPSTWVDVSGFVAGVPLSSLLAATVAHAIDSLNFAQTWRWTTLAGQTALSLVADAITGGTILAVRSPSVLQTGSLASFVSASTAAVTTGLVSILASGAYTAGAALAVATVTATGKGVHVKGDALTTGSLLDVEVNSGLLATLAGVLRVANVNATLQGVLARFQASSAAGSGVTMLCNGNTGFGTDAPDAGIHNAGSTIFGALAVGDTAAPGMIGGLSAAASVDIATSFNVNQTTAGALALTLQNPTAATAGRVVYVSNVGAEAFSLYGASIAVGATLMVYWTGAAWSPVI